MILSLYSYYLICNKKKIGFIIGLIGSIIGIIFFINISTSLIIMYISFSILNIIGYKNWNKSKKIGI